jgi:hypothetical protein
MQTIPSNEFDGEIEEIGLESPPSAEEHVEGAEFNTTVGLGGHEVTVDTRMAPYIGQVIAAIVLLIAVATKAGDIVNQGYGIAAAVIAMIFGLGGMYISPLPDFSSSPLGTFPFLGNLTYGGALAKFLFVWWFVAAAILTFSGPFLITSNGYFACWGGVVFAAMAIGVSPEQIKSQAGGLGYLNGLLVASIILISSVPSFIGKGKTFHTECVYALVVGILTLVAILGFNFNSSVTIEAFKFPFFALFSVLWIVLACLVTFRGPFIETGNGYFASWIGCVLCVAVTAVTRRQAETVAASTTSMSDSI